MGFKPLYYMKSDKQIIISSSLETFRLKIDLKLNKNRIKNFLTNGFGVNNETFFDGIYKFPKATYFSIIDLNIKKYNYYKLKITEIDYTKNEETYINEFKNIFFNVIESQL